MGRYVSCTSASIPTYSCRLNVIGACCCLWTVPANVSSVTFEIWGGGGAGGQKCCCRCEGTSAGAGGGYSIKTVSVSSGQQFTICAGNGGCVNYCAAGGTSYGCAGGTSYVTGTGLSNFCAVGGTGGCWPGCSMSGCYCWGGMSYGGDVNIPSGRGHMTLMWDGYCQMSVGGPSPLGGGESGKHNNHCCMGGCHGCWGSFPGGGGTGVHLCCCDCCWCNGGGGPGLVRVTF